MKKMTKLTGVSSIILLLFLLSTNPQNLPSILLVVPFIVLFVIILALVIGASGIYGGSTPGRLRVGVLAASAPVILLVLQSLGQLTVRDTLAVFVLFGVAYLYMSRFGARVAG